MRSIYARAYQLLRQARKHGPLTPAHNTFWGRRILKFERTDRRHFQAMRAAARSFGGIIEGGEFRRVKHL